MPVSINNTTLTFNDATTQTTSGVTSVSAGTGISVAGGKTPTVTNTGVTSVTAGSGISVSASTGSVTISASGGGVTSLNGQTGAITNTDFAVIGSYVIASRTNQSIALQGSTVAGSGLYYANTGNYQSGSFISNGTFGSENYTTFDIVGGYRRASGNIGLAAPLGTSTLSGTWRVLSVNRQPSMDYDGDNNRSNIYYYNQLYVRIS